MAEKDTSNLLIFEGNGYGDRVALRGRTVFAGGSWDARSNPRVATLSEDTVPPILNKQSGLEQKQNFDSSVFHVFPAVEKENLKGTKLWFLYVSEWCITSVFTHEFTCQNVSQSE